MPIISLHTDPSDWQVSPDHTAIGTDENGNLAVKQPDGTVQTILPGGTNISEHEQVNNAGDSTVTIGNVIHTEAINFTGASGTRRVFLSPIGAVPGCQIRLLALFNNSSAILVSIYDTDALGAPLATFVTDVQPNAIYELYRTAAGAWKLLRTQIPAY